MKKRIQPPKVYIKQFDTYYKENISQIRFHGMPFNKTWHGVYKMMLSDNFYIGRSVNIMTRMKQHRQELNKIMREGYREEHYLRNVVEFVKERKLTSFDVHLLCECNSSNELEKEQEWLSNYENDPNCLNTGFVAKLSSYEMKLLNFKPVLLSEEFVFNTEKEYNLYLNFKEHLVAMQKYKQCHDQQ